MGVRHGTPFFFSKSHFDGLTTPWHSQLVNYGNKETHSTASAAYSRHRQEHPAVAVGIKKQQAQGQGTLPDNNGETTDRPKSD